MRHFTIPFVTIITIFLSSCTKEIKDEPVGAYSFTAVAESVQAGDDIPVHLSFSDAGLIVDNASWGDKWKKATFYAELLKDDGSAVDNVVYGGPGGTLRNGSIFDIAPSGKMDIIVSALDVGSYVLKLNIRTRYTVDTWASTTITVLERKDGPAPVEIVYVEDISVPDADNGFDIDDIGNVILDLRYYNASNPFVYRSSVRPSNATNKQLVADSGDPSVASIKVDGETLLVVTPAKKGVVKMTVRSADGRVTKTFGVKVVESAPDADGFTLPADDSERENFDFDVAGRLALDINTWNDDKPFEYVCRPIPENATKPSLKAESDTPDVLVAAIRDGNRLVLTPKSPGYAVVTVSTTDNTIVRTLRVAVISNVQLVIDVVEETPSAEDEKNQVFPCRLTLKSSSRWYPTRMRAEFHVKGTGRIVLSDPVDYFKVDSLKNSRTAYYSVEDKIPVLYLSNGNSAYQLYDRVMKKVVAMGTVIHHSDDYPKYYDYVEYFKLYRLAISISMIEEYDTNIYRVTLVEDYNSPENKLYRYLF